MSVILPQFFWKIYIFTEETINVGIGWLWVIFLQIFSAEREQKTENSIHGEKSNQLCKSWLWGYFDQVYTVT